MYYRLAKHISLRGWERLPYGYVDTQNHRAHLLSRREFEVLQLCDGHTDFSSSLIFTEIRETLPALLEQGLIQLCEQGRGIEADQAYWKYPNRLIHSAQWSITGTCNYRCRHCFMEAPHAKQRDLTTDQLLDIADQLASCGIQSVSLTGGEPLLRRDFLQIVARIRENGMELSQVYTNGSLITGELLESLKRLDVCPTFCISYDGPGCHDWSRGVQGAEEAVRQGFLLCREQGFPTVAEMTLFPQNLHHIIESAQRLASWGCSLLKVGTVRDAGEWQRTGLEAPRLEDVWQVYLDLVPSWAEAGFPLPVLQLGELFLIDSRAEEPIQVIAVKHCTDPATTLLCPEARLDIHITAEGQVLPCAPMEAVDATSLQFPFVTQLPLQAILSQSSLWDFTDQRASAYFAANPECASCPHGRECLGGCRAQALAVDPSCLLGKDPITCALFSDGWVDRAKALAKFTVGSR